MADISLHVKHITYVLYCICNECYYVRNKEFVSAMTKEYLKDKVNDLAMNSKNSSAEAKNNVILYLHCPA